MRSILSNGEIRIDWPVDSHRGSGQALAEGTSLAANFPMNHRFAPSHEA
jgi:hypothetical protein